MQGKGKLSQPAPMESLTTLEVQDRDINVVYEGDFDMGKKHGSGR